MAYQKKPYVKPPDVVRIPFKPTYPASKEQAAIFEVISLTDDNIHCEASPGSGKSTTLKWAMTKEPRQKAAMLAFGKEIVKEIEPGCAPNVEVRTAHSFGYRALSSRFGRLFLSNGKVQNLYRELFPGLDPDKKTGPEKGVAYGLMFDTVSLIEKLRLTLTDETNMDAVQETATQFGIDLDMNHVAKVTPKLYEGILGKPNVIDYTDMMWLAIRLNLPIPKFDMIYLDERQDMNNLMMEYVNRMYSERIMTVGDSCQSIFGFAGADTQATQRLIGRFPGRELPLNVCYRCGTDIVELARTVYDKILPFEKNPTGLIQELDSVDLTMPDGSMILCRRNAGLIKPCFALLKAGRKAIIKGRNIGEGLVKLIKQLNATDVFDLMDKLEVHKEKRVEKLLAEEKPRTAQIDAVIDECDCIKQIAEVCGSVAEVIDRIELLFSEETKGIVLSSIHRSKGLESDQVAIVDYSRIRLNHDKMTEADHVQEANLHFVAVTRAKKVLQLIG